jgi:ubiquinone biosynthesis protein UbiJ
VLTQAIENLLNRNLAASPRARELCAALAGRKVVVDLAGTGLALGIEAARDSLHLRRDPTGECDARLSGTVVDLLALAGSAPERALQRGRLALEGNSQVAQDFRELVLLLRPDAEEELSKLVGDALAHRVANFTHGLFEAGRRSARTGVRNVAEYLAHESRDLVPRAEADAQFAQVDRLREDADRLAARLDLLGSKAH